MDEVRARCLNNVISVLLEQRKIVVSRGATFAGHLIDLTIMQLRLTGHDISEEELSEFSKFLSADFAKRGKQQDWSGGVSLPGQRWTILAVLFAVRAATGFQFQSVGSASSMLMQDLAMDYSQIGMLLGAYLLPGVIVAFPAGVLGQRFRDKTLGLAGLLLMAVSGVMLGASGDFTMALVARLIG